MSETVKSTIKQREIQFCTLHPDPRQAHTAAAYLEELPGVVEVNATSAHQLEVRYDLGDTCLLLIERELEERGFHLDNGLVVKIRRALYHYSEETQITNLHCEQGESNCTQKVFINRYRKLSHGCRDDRPAHWRKYL